MSQWYLTQSLLSSWQHYLDADDSYSDAAFSSFLLTLRREPKEVTPAMQAGIDFENAINITVAGGFPESVNAKWDNAVKCFSAACMGGQSQTPVSGELHTADMDFCLYGLCDYVKAGVIYDIKKVTRYEYGKYYHSPQHPMYLHLLPEATKFTYLIFDGSNIYRETYRRGDYTPIKDTISKFVRWLNEMNLMDDYKTYWSMTKERMEKVHGI